MLIEEGIGFGMELGLQDAKGHGVSRTVVINSRVLDTFGVQGDIVGGGVGLGRWWVDL